jgi:hypothetical protein
VTSGTGLILNQNADAGLIQLTTSKNADAGQAFSWPLVISGVSL